MRHLKLQDFKISVVIPTFNRSNFILRAIMSVLDQTYAPYEIIIIDDGSTDDTKAVVPSHPKIKYFYQDNAGVSAARNRGVLQASSQWIAFLDSDDEWIKSKLLLQVEYLKENSSCQFLHTNESWFRNNIRVNKIKKHIKGGGNQFIPSLSQCLISPSTVLLKKDLFIDLGGFREDFEVCEDYDLWLKITSRFDIGYLSEELIIKYAGHEDQLSMKLPDMDFYRIQSLYDLFKQEHLSHDQRSNIESIIKFKSERLRKGYMKHQRIDRLKIIDAIIDSLE